MAQHQIRIGQFLDKAKGLKINLLAVRYIGDFRILTDHEFGGKGDFGRVDDDIALKVAHDTEDLEVLCHAVQAGMVGVGEGQSALGLCNLGQVDAQDIIATAAVEMVGDGGVGQINQDGIIADAASELDVRRVFRKVNQGPAKPSDCNSFQPRNAEDGQRIRFKPEDGSDDRGKVLYEAG